MIERKGFQPFRMAGARDWFASLVQTACRPRLAAGTARPDAGLIG